MKSLGILLIALLISPAFAADLTGNWVAENPLPDGTVRKTYFDLKQEAGRITGHVRSSQFYFPNCESTGTAENFTLTCTMQDGETTRRAVFEGKLAGEELHMSTRRRPDAPLVEHVAHRAPAGEGALPAKIPPPPLH
ncbi:MAG TPA: hypothetical protein VG498_04290, partial [Terriglobales bacterium]|nr:hypothetical protein [Terriglobales bacterium]